MKSATNDPAPQLIVPVNSPKETEFTRINNYIWAEDSQTLIMAAAPEADCHEEKYWQPTAQSFFNINDLLFCEFSFYSVGATVNQLSDYKTNALSPGERLFLDWLP